MQHRIVIVNIFGKNYPRFKRSWLYFVFLEIIVIMFYLYCYYIECYIEIIIIILTSILRTDILYPRNKRYPFDEYTS